MMTKKTFRALTYHVVGITSFILFEVVILFFHKSNASIWEFVGYYIFEISFFYISAYIFIEWLKRVFGKINLKFFLASLVWIGAFTFFDVLYTNVLYSIRGRTLTNEEIQIFIVKLLFRFIYFYSLAFGLWSSRYLVKRERDLRNQDVALLTSQNEKSQVEIALLRSQITPHLMLNTLNGVYNLVMVTNSKAAVLVELLMDNLHLSLKGSDPEKETLLKEEIQLVRNIINLYAQLGKPNCILRVDLDNQILDRPFPVNIIATLVENVFKHGDLSDESRPAKVTITGTPTYLKVEIENKVLGGPSNSRRGIGIENINNRLMILFKDRYELHVAHTPEYFSSLLQIEF